jgi:acyl-CoA thioesterase I
MMRRVVFVCAWIVCGFFVYAPATPAIAARTLLVYGDSLSAGYGLPRDQAWVNLLAERLKQQRIDYTVANASISGETTLGGLRRINGALAQHQPAIVLIALGANDGLRGQNVDSMRKNLEAMIDACRKSKSQVVLIGMRVPPNYGSAYTDKFHAVYGDIARRYKLPLVPFLLEGFAENPEWFQADGVHPAARAQPAMLETVWKTLAPLLPAQAQAAYKK